MNNIFALNLSQSNVSDRIKLQDFFFTQHLAFLLNLPIALSILNLSYLPKTIKMLNIKELISNHPNLSKLILKSNSDSLKINVVPLFSIIEYSIFSDN